MGDEFHREDECMEKPSSIKQILNALGFLGVAGTTALVLSTTTPETKEVDEIEKKPAIIHVDQTFPYQERYDSLTAAKFDELRTRLVEEFGQRPERVDSLFRDESVSLDSLVERRFKRNVESRADRGTMTYERYRELLDVDGLKFKAPLFLEDNVTDLLEAEEKFGVDYRYIVGILGVETRYGGYLGSHNLVDALVTQYVSTNRKTFAARELSSLLDYAEITGMDLEELNQIPSSYAGAGGIAQWIPSSLRSLFTGRTGNMAEADIWDPGDAIFSIANYLRHNNGWHSRARRRTNWNPNYNGSNINYMQGNWFALWAYNRSPSYVRAVSEIAESLPRITASERRNILGPVYAEEEKKESLTAR